MGFNSGFKGLTLNKRTVNDSRHWYTECSRKSLLH